MAYETTVTAEGLERLREELQRLKGDERTRAAESIREAKSHGDLKENAMYHEAKLNQARLDTRISELERFVELAQVLDENELRAGVAHIGSTVRLRSMKGSMELEVMLVGAWEADPEGNKISIASPIGSALVGRKAGEEIDVQTPGGAMHYHIDSVA